MDEGRLEWCISLGTQGSDEDEAEGASTCGRPAAMPNGMARDRLVPSFASREVSRFVAMQSRTDVVRLKRIIGYLIQWS